MEFNRFRNPFVFTPYKRLLLKGLTHLTLSNNESYVEKRRKYCRNYALSSLPGIYEVVREGGASQSGLLGV